MRLSHSSLLLWKGKKQEGNPYYPSKKEYTLCFLATFLFAILLEYINCNITRDYESLLLGKYIPHTRTQAFTGQGLTIELRNQTLYIEQTNQIQATPREKHRHQHRGAVPRQTKKKPIYTVSQANKEKIDLEMLRQSGPMV